MPHSPIDELIGFQLDLDRFSKTQARELRKTILAKLAEVTAAIDKANPHSIETLKVERQILRRIRSELTGIIAGRVEVVRDAAARASWAAYSGYLDGIKPDALDSIVAISPGEIPPLVFERVARQEYRGRTWARWSRNLSERAVDRIDSELRKASFEGLTGEETVSKVRKVIKKAGIDSETMVRTATTAAANESAKVALSEAGVGRWRFTATLDHVTSNICKGLDGTIWGTDNPSAPYPPRHPNCRSVMVAVFPGQDEDQAVPESYEDWFAARSKKEQREILGPGKFKAFEAGVPFSGLATSDAELTVADLQLKYPQAFQ